MSYHQRLRSTCGEARSAGDERAELHRRRGREARFGLVARVAARAQVVHPDPDGAVRRRGRRSETPGQRRVGPPRPDACRRRWQRRERPEAAEAVVAVERLRTRDLCSPASEQIGAHAPAVPRVHGRPRRRPRRDRARRRTAPGRRRVCSRRRPERREDSGLWLLRDRRPRRARAPGRQAAIRSARRMRTLYRSFPLAPARSSVTSSSSFKNGGQGGTTCGEHVLLS